MVSPCTKAKPSSCTWSWRVSSVASRGAFIRAVYARPPRPGCGKTHQGGALQGLQQLWFVERRQQRRIPAIDIVLVSQLAVVIDIDRPVGQQDRHLGWQG